MSALPRLTVQGSVSPRGLLTALFDPPPGGTGRDEVPTGRPHSDLVPDVSVVRLIGGHVIVTDAEGGGHAGLMIDAESLAQLVTDAVASEISASTRTIVAEVNRAQAGRTT